LTLSTLLPPAAATCHYQPTHNFFLFLVTLPVNLEKAEDHLGLVFVDKVPNQTVLDTMTGATKKVDQINILLVVPDIDDVIVHNLYEAFLCSPRHVMVVYPAAPSIFCSRRIQEFEQACRHTGTANEDELEARSVSLNAMEQSDHRKVHILMLEFDEDVYVESKYFQHPKPDGQLDHIFTEVQYQSQLALIHTNTVLKYRLSVVPDEDRILRGAPSRGMSDFDILRRRLQNTTLGGGVQQQQYGGPGIQQQQFGGGIQQQQFGGQQQQQQHPFGGQQQHPFGGGQQQLPFGGAPPPFGGGQQQPPPPFVGGQQQPPPFGGGQQQPPPVGGGQQQPPPVGGGQQLAADQPTSMGGNNRLGEQV
jgi:hypothetical protein